MKRHVVALLLCLTAQTSGSHQVVTDYLTTEKIPFFGRYNFSFITEEAGLPNNFVHDICKDSQGFIWVATNNGIGRYDGYHFISYNTQTSGTTLKSDYVHTLCEDSFHRLWIGTEEGMGLVSLDRYVSVDLEALLPDGLKPMASSYIEHIYRDLRGDLWISTYRNLYCLEMDADGGIKEYYSLEKESDSPVHAVIDLQWCVSAGIGGQLVRIAKEPGHRLKAHPLSPLLKPYSDDWRIHCMALDGESLWIGTNRGLFKYSHTHQTVERYRYSNRRPGMLSQAYITDIKLTAKGEIIVSTLNGLNVYHRDTNTFTYIRQNNALPDKSLNCNLINCLLTTGEDIWAGTETGGINLLTPCCLQTRTWQYNGLSDPSLSPNPVNAINEDKEGNLWVGTVGKGLNKRERGSDKFTLYTYDVTPTSISNNSISGILIDSENHLWAYTWGVGINELDLNIPHNKTFIRHEREDSVGLDGDFISSACEDTLNNGLWFGTTRGLHFYHKPSQRFTRVLFPQSDNEFNAVGSILIDRRHRLWFGTSEGLFIMDVRRFSPHSPQVRSTYLKHNLSDPDLPQTEKINCILQDRKGNIWLGSNGNGLYLWIENERTTDRQKETNYAFKNYTIANGLPNNTIVGMVEDSLGCLWLSTNNGLSRLAPSGMTFTNFTKEDGLPSNLFYAHAAHYSPDTDQLYFGTINGLVAFTPSTVEIEQTDAKAVISSVTLANSTCFPVSPSSYPVCFHEREQGVSIDISSLNYGNAARVKYAYRLLRGDEAQKKSPWTETPAGEHTVKFSYLPAGKYLFQVRATDEKGHWSEKITELPIEVSPNFYKTWWFILLLFLFAGSAVYSYFLWKTRMYRRQRSRLQAEVERQTCELQAQNKELKRMARHIEEITAGRTPSRDSDFLARAVSLMKEHYGDSDYDLSRFVRDMGYSKTLVNQRLQTLTGQSIGQFMKNYRLTVAKETLTHAGVSDISISEVAYAVGFNDPKYFTKCFRELFGTTPSEIVTKK